MFLLVSHLTTSERGGSLTGGGNLKDNGFTIFSAASSRLGMPVTDYEFASSYSHPRTSGGIRPSSQTAHHHTLTTTPRTITSRTTTPRVRARPAAPCHAPACSRLRHRVADFPRRAHPVTHHRVSLPNAIAAIPHERNEPIPHRRIGPLRRAARRRRAPPPRTAAHRRAPPPCAAARSSPRATARADKYAQWRCRTGRCS